MSDLEERPLGETWRRAAELVGVSFPERTIELVVMPYDTPIGVMYAGRPVQETIARGAFDGIQRRAKSRRPVPVNVDHEERVPSTIGKAVALHPNRPEGLVAEIRIARTPLGDDTLALAAEGDIGASAGFMPMEDGLEWRGRDAYTVTRAYLKHIAMTPDPAYEDARVLAVRNRVELPDEPVATPNLDRIRAEILAERYASL